MNDSFNIIGEIDVKLYDENQQLIDFRHVNNKVVTVGKIHMLTRLIGTGVTTMSYMGLGSGSTPTDVSMTSLISPILNASNQRNTVVSVVDPILPKITYTATFGTEITGTVTVGELGIFSALTAGTMFSRGTFTPISKANGHTLNVTWNITVQ